MPWLHERNGGDSDLTRGHVTAAAIIVEMPMGDDMDCLVGIQSPQCLEEKSTDGVRQRGVLHLVHSRLEILGMKLKVKRHLLHREGYCDGDTGR